MKRTIPPIDSISTARLSALLNQALEGRVTDASSDEMLALSNHALRACGAAYPAKVTVSQGHRTYLAPATVLAFVRPGRGQCADR